MARRKRRESKKDNSAPLVVVAGLIVGGWVLSSGQSKVHAFLLPAVIGVGALVVAAALFYFWNRSNASSKDAGLPSPRVEPVHVDSHSDTDYSHGFDAWYQSSNAKLTRVEASKPTKWNLAVLQSLEWHRIELISAALFERLGFTAKTTPFGADGGVDIHLYRESSERPAAIVQCKAWSTAPVGVKPVRELRGVMASENIAEGIFVATSTFTREARDFAKNNAIDLLDGEAMIAAIRALSAEQQQSLLAMATQGDYQTPTCASCGATMVRRTPKAGGVPFWGCSTFPKCGFTLRMRSDIES